MPQRTAQKAFASALSTDKDWRLAVDAAAAQVKEDLNGASCDLALLFVSESYPGLKPELLPGLVSERLSCKNLLGCNASGVLAGGREVEMEPAVALMGLSLPGTKLVPFHHSPKETEAMASGSQLLEALEIFPNERPKFIALADPMTTDIEQWVRVFNEAYPGCPVVGGLASGMAVGRPNWILLGPDVYASGSAGLALCGDVDFDIVVAQGCRPIGEPLIVTKAQGHVLSELGGKPPLEVLKAVISASPAEDQALARHSLFAGVVIDEYHSAFKRGDFLIRNLMGYDAQTGALMVGTNLRVGQTLQFQLRDAKTSAEDLRQLLESVKAGGGARGAFLVSCCGRGRGLYGKPDHDSRMIETLKGPLPLAGFFANGEIGPVSGRNYIHGYTSSIAIIR